MNTETNNKLMAEFMGLTIITDNISYFDTNYKALKKYHSDWNWLMEVVEKIESVKSYDRDVFGTEVKIYKDKCTIKSGHYNTKGVVYSKEQYFDGIKQEKSKIESVYNACVEFIKWYNKQSK